MWQLVFQVVFDYALVALTLGLVYVLPVPDEDTLPRSFGELVVWSLMWPVRLARIVWGLLRVS